MPTLGQNTSESDQHDTTYLYVGIRLYQPQCETSLSFYIKKRSEFTEHYTMSFSAPYKWMGERVEKMA